MKVLVNGQSSLLLSDPCRFSQQSAHDLTHDERRDYEKQSQFQSDLNLHAEYSQQAQVPEVDAARRCEREQEFLVSPPAWLPASVAHQRLTCIVVARFDKPLSAAANHLSGWIVPIPAVSPH